MDESPIDESAIVIALVDLDYGFAGLAGRVAGCVGQRSA
jgi:hypothetical protein